MYLVDDFLRKEEVDHFLRRGRAAAASRGRKNGALRRSVVMTEKGEAG